MDWSNLIVQLGISALVLFVVYKIGMVLVVNMRTADSERTIAMAKAEADRTMAIREGFTAVASAQNALVATVTLMQSQVLASINGMQNQLVSSINGMQNQNYRMEGKLDTVLDLTPVRGMMKAELPLENRKAPSVVVDHNALHDDEKTPVDAPRTPTPTQKVKAAPRAPTSGGYYGPYGPKKPG